MFFDLFRRTSRTAAGCPVIAAMAILILPAVTRAASITIDAPEMQAIFSQSAFGGTPVDIRFNAPRIIVAPQLLDIETGNDLKALYALAPDPAPTVDAFFVDQLDACGSVEARVNGVYAGCAQLPGHIFVEASDEAELSPAPLMGHELGHNLDLQHDLFSSVYLMYSLFPPGTVLTEGEAATILQSPLVQTDSTGRRFIQITPIAIAAAPEPAAFPLVAAALGALLLIQHKRRRCSTRLA